MNYPVIEMRICYIATTVHISKNFDECMGGTTHTFSIAKEFVKQGHEVHLICKKMGSDSDFEVIEGINVHRLFRGIFTTGETIRKMRSFGISIFLRKFANMALALKISKIIRQKNCDVIFERAHSLEVGTITSKLTKKPLFVEVIDKFFSNTAIKHSKKLFAYTKVFFEKKLHKKIVLVSAGFDPELFRSIKMKPEYDICYSGSFKRWDGLKDLVLTVKNLKNKRQFNDLKVLLLGMGDKFNEIKKMVKENDLNKNFIFLGKVPLKMVPTFIAKSKICVAPYNVKNDERNDFGKHGFNFSPLKVVEYMACAKPVIATNYETIAKIIPQNSRFLFEEGNIESLSKKIEMVLIGNSIKKIGKKNLLAVKKLRWKNVCEKILDELSE